MSFKSIIQETWHQFLESLHPDERQQLLDMLRDEYGEESQEVAQLTQHAERMAYPQFRQRLLKIADEEHAHVQWLRDKILALGGELPQIHPTPKMGKNSWECLLMALEVEQRSCEELLTRIHTAEHADPEIMQGLQRIRAEKQRHREEIRTLLMQSEPYAHPDPTLGHPELAQQKHAWLEHQKMVWLNAQKTHWEEQGKPIPWAEWLGEKEYEWERELPNHELEWERHMAEQTGH